MSTSTIMQKTYVLEYEYEYDYIRVYSNVIVLILEYICFLSNRTRTLACSK